LVPLQATRRSIFATNPPHNHKTHQPYPPKLSRPSPSRSSSSSPRSRPTLESAALSIADEKPPVAERQTAAAAGAAALAEEEKKKSNPLKEILKALFGCLRKQVGDQLKDAGMDKVKKQFQEKQDQVQQQTQQGQDSKDGIVTSTTGVARITRYLNGCWRMVGDGR
jgi:hypothetical protein